MTEAVLRAPSLLVCPLPCWVLGTFVWKPHPKPSSHSVPRDALVLCKKTQPVRESRALSEARHVPAAFLLFLFRLFPSEVAIVTHSPPAPPVLCILFLTMTNLVSSMSKHLPAALPLYLMPGRSVYGLPLLWAQSGPSR